MEATAPVKSKPLTKKQVEKVDNAVALFTKTMQYRIIVNTHSKIANSPLPKKKAIKHQQLLSEWVAKSDDLYVELEALIDKLNPRQLELYAERCQQLQP